MFNKKFTKKNRSNSLIRKAYDKLSTIRVTDTIVIERLYSGKVFLNTETEKKERILEMLDKARVEIEDEN